ncbi:MAG TPA: hypothetical protein VHW04_00080 [Solirubrobacteraceae bacterium]|jgi:hypothetical protein|nr:hypothetical protein [Solirubrobacteraceae bacterium]
MARGAWTYCPAGRPPRRPWASSSLPTRSAPRAGSTIVSLRVEDHPEPLAELDRLLVLDAAYKLAGEGDERVAAGDIDAAARFYQRAHELVPDAHELRFWAGLGAAQRAEADDGLALVASAIAQQPGWRELLPRLAPEQWPVAAELLERLRIAEAAG